jgi:hypothetical protein
MFGAAVGTCEQGVFAIERDGTDGSFDGVVIEFDAAVVDEAGQALPVGHVNLGLVQTRAEVGGSRYVRHARLRKALL